MRAGQSEHAAKRTAAAAERPQRLIIDYGMLGEFVFEADADGKWTPISGPPGPDSRPMTSAEWERIAPPGKD